MRHLSMIPVLLGVLCSGPLAHAQQAGGDDRDLVTRYGMAAFVGAGVGGFIDDGRHAFAYRSTRWEARFQLGTRTPISLEATYTGSLQALGHGLGVLKNAYLLENGAEVSVRGNVPAGPIVAFGFAGAGWTHFDLTNYETRTADVQDHDDVLVVPFGLGLSYRHAHTIADVRAAYRFAFDEDLVLMSGSTTEHMNMDEWMVALCGGFEF